MSKTNHLTIDYRLNGPRPGYQFTTPTDGIPDSDLKTIWRQAMPRGQGWGSYIGARSIKCFAVGHGRLAISEVLVTDRADEEGRLGLRRAEITVMSQVDYEANIRARLRSYPVEVRKAAGQRMDAGRWVRVLLNAVPRLSGKEQAVLTHPYTTPGDWAVLEFMVLYLSTRWSVRAVRGLPPVVPLTTLALDHNEEASITAIPASKLGRTPGGRVIRIP